MSGREEKHEAEEKAHDEEEEEEEEDDDNDDISSSGGDDDDSGSEDDMSESDDARGSDSKATAGSGGGASAPSNSCGSSTEQAARSAKEQSFVNQPFDEAVDLSESEGSMSEGGVDSPKKKPTAQVKNQPFDEALELSGSVQDIESPQKPAAAQKAPASTPAASSAQQSAGRKSPNKAPASKNATAAALGAEIKNKPHDEEVDLSDSDGSVDTDGHPSPDRATIKNRAAAVPTRDEKPAAKVEAARSSPAPSKDSTPPSSASVPSNSTSGSGRGMPAAATATSSATATAYSGPAKTQQQDKRQIESKRSKQESESSSEESGSDEDDDDDDEEEEDEEEESQSASVAVSAGGGAAAGGAANASGSVGNSAQSAMMANAGSYKESDYAHLKVSNDVRELFQYIGRFKAQEVELETRLKCFIPEYIPAVGDMDAFLKIPRPDGEPDHLGLKMLDEPSLSQSDATVLDLQLRSTSKKKHGDIVVRSIENAEKSPKEIDRWIKSIADLHRTKPPPQVHYSKAMPDIESLMQVWPEEFEELLAKTPLPSARMDLALEQYIRVICAILDIPVHKNVFESLHVLFTLYLEFRSNQHFMNYDEQLESAQQLQQRQQQMQRGEMDAPPPFTSRRTEISTPDSFSSRK